MPRHLHNPSSSRRWLAYLSVAVTLALVVTGLWWLTSQEAAPESASTQPASSEPSTAQGNLTPQSQAPASDMPTNMPVQTPEESSPPATNPVTGRVDTLNGLVPDYVLPPIENGMVPVLTKVPTDQKVVFLTIDDGAVKRESDLALLEKNGLKASLFLAHNFIADNPGFYKSYTAAGHLIEDHTMTHNLGFIQLSYEQQRAEICGMADFAEQQYGRRPVFFRPPGGPYTQVTRQAAADCGMKAIVDWEAKANAGGMDYQIGAGLRPGDIVLMHFRPEFEQDLTAFMQAQQAAGLQVVLLEDYLATQ